MDKINDLNNYLLLKLKIYIFLPENQLNLIYRN